MKQYYEEATAEGKHCIKQKGPLRRERVTQELKHDNKKRGNGGLQKQRPKERR